ncbi:MAG: ABC transporter permease [Actinomycetota bacterium]|nr:ABC transporter permease [Actinomycetota bacterium]
MTQLDRMEASPPAPADAALIMTPERPGRQIPLGLFVTPIIVLGICYLTYLYVTRGELQAVERGSLAGDQLVRLTGQHLRVSLISTLIVLATAIPLGVLLTRRGGRTIAVAAGTAANIGQAATAFGVMVLFLVGFKMSGITAAILGMAVYSFLPVLSGTVTGIQQVDPNVVKSALAMGMSRWQVLRRVELPLSVPVLLAGVRTALVLNVATTTVAALVGAGGLGLLIVTGFTAGRDSLIIMGGVATAGIAILADWLGAVAERVLRPKGLRSAQAPTPKGVR